MNIKIEKGKTIGKRIDIEPSKIKIRFMNSLNDTSR